RCLEPRPFDDTHDLAGQVAPGFGLETVGVVDEHGLDGVVAAGKQQRRRAGHAAVRGPVKTSGADMRFAVRSFGDQLPGVFDRYHSERKAELFGEQIGEIAIEARRDAFGTDEPRGRSRPHRDHELLRLLLRRRFGRRWTACGQGADAAPQDESGASGTVKHASHWFRGSYAIPTR